ncbi:serine/threonine protein kinase [Roseibium denhamense]|uniref:Serine/threonine protein kinase n=1 Tax=Roseibium denhamense TaxID=76305 RepID=A0ABY1NS80_9HYPH|nr:serine/threonine-protein kinase [Roseibium denhamense]MTI08023.1 serine/threonine protein kinase [Roseibium denhamense]SMP15602.1 serine/threonine protein kinase [Roseibium denhamense]
MAAPDHLLPTGTRLNNLYEIEAHIADGGIGTVYRARDIESGDPVAVKVLLASFSRDPLIVDLFKREAKILRKLKHDALTQYYVFAKEPELGFYYLAMEFVEGPSLSSRLAAGPLEPEAVYRLVTRLASALQAVHDREVIHRDLSPDNIILQNGDVTQAKIIDFGISRSNAAGPTIIGDGFAGKVNYVSPEQVGIFDGKVTPRSDVYSLGLVIAEALTGRQIDMGGTQVQIVEKRRTLPPLEGIDMRFRPLLEAMLQPDPANRPASMSEIAAWTMGAPLQPRTDDRTIIRPSGPPPEQSVLDAPPQKTNWIARIAILLSLIGFAGVGAAAVFFLAGPTVDAPDQRPVLIAEPRPNAPEAPVTSGPAPASPEPDDQEADAQISEPDTAIADEVEEQTVEVSEPEATVPEPPSPLDNLVKLPGPDPVEDPLPGPQTSIPEEGTGPEQTVGAKEPVLTAADKVRNFVTGYQADECMYLQPTTVAARSAAIEGFAARTPPFIAFDSDFTRVQGFEAKIQVNLITDAQCPALGFLRGTPQGNGLTQLHLDMQRTVIQSGANLAGRISGFDPDAGELGLVIVGSDGSVSNLTPYLQSDNGGAGFVIPVNLESGQDDTSLIIAMVGPEMIETLAGMSRADADSVFDSLNKSASVLRATATTIRVTP